MQDFSALEGKTLSELREIGKVLGITDTTLRKKELLEQWLWPQRVMSPTPDKAARSRL